MEPLRSAWIQLPVSLVLALNAAKRLLGASTFPGPSGGWRRYCCHIVSRPDWHRATNRFSVT